MKLKLSLFAIGGVLVLLLAAGFVSDCLIPKPVELAVWKERCAGWRVADGYFTDESGPFFATGQSKLIRQGEPIVFGFSYGDTGFGVGSPSAEGSEEPPPPPIAERDTLAVMLVKKSGEEPKRYKIAVVMMER